MWEFLVTKPDRLDRLLRSSSQNPWMGRQAWERALAEGWVKVNGRVVRKPGEQVGAGCKVEANLPESLGLIADSSPANLVWLSPGRELAVFEKVSGAPTYPLLPWERGTLANGIARVVEEKGWLGPGEFAALAAPPLLEGGLLQRLDLHTSGLVSAALTKEAKARYRRMFSGDVEKSYLAIVVGSVETGTYTVGFLPGEGAKVHAVKDERAGAKPVKLKVKVLGRAGEIGLVEVETSQGLRHVVRAGLAAIGAPLAGDSLYGGESLFPNYQLHGHVLKIPGFEPIHSRVPQSFLDCLRKVGLHYQG